MAGRSLFCTLALIMSLTQVHAQFSPSAIKIGFLNPKDTAAGLLMGTEFTYDIDETVQLGIAPNVFYKNFTRKTAVAASDAPIGVNEVDVLQELEYTSAALPIFAVMNVLIPSSRNYGYHFQGGLGWTFLYNHEKNFAADKSNRRFYSGFSWISSLGLYYRLGSRSTLIGELLYHSGRVKRNKSETTEGLPVWTEVNFSGPGIRFGVRFGLM